MATRIPLTAVLAILLLKVDIGGAAWIAPTKGGFPPSRFAQSTHAMPPATESSFPTSHDKLDAVGMQPERAEFAVRWNPAEGGFHSAQEVLDFLQAPRRIGEHFEIQYFNFKAPANAPQGATSILRQRWRANGKSEIRLKYRRPAPLVGPWSCPSDAPYEQSEEVDIGFTASGKPNRVYSYSCTVLAPASPASLEAVPKPCRSQMVRYEFHKMKIEEWTFPDGNVQIEVSRATRNTEEEFAKFANLVSSLRAHGVKVLQQSKTESGSQCP